MKNSSEESSSVYPPTSPGIALKGRDPDLLSDEELDDLPLGVIGLDAEGNIKSYNRYESQFSGRKPLSVIGKNFFDQVAPCTNVPEFKGRFRAGVKSQNLSEHFLFNFDFDMTPPVKVAVELRQSVRPGHYWLLTLVLEKRDSHDLDSPQAVLSATSEHTDMCASEPIHRVNAIQPWGALLIAEADSGNIAAQSQNFTELLQLPERTYLDCNLADFLDQESLIRLSSLQTAKRGVHHDTRTLSGRFDDCKELLNIRATEQSGYYFLEFHINLEVNSDTGLDQKMVDVLTEIDRTDDIASLTDCATKAVQDITGFARVLVYQFDSDWNGRTIAEQLVDPKLQSFSGLLFPEGDIPKQARQLYHYNHARFTPSRDYTPVTIDYSDKAADEAQDLSTTQLRSVSPIHREYHRALGVNGSFSLSLMVRKKLWGMIIAHHRAPRHLDIKIRNALTVIRLAVQSKIDTLITRDHERDVSQTSSAYLAIIERLDVGSNLFDHLMPFEGKSILDLFSCSAAAIVYEGDMRRSPAAPPEPLVKSLLEETLPLATNGLFHTRSLSGLLPAFAEYKELCSGAIIALPDNTTDFAFIWFFPAEIEELTWAGNPHEKTVVESKEQGQMALPRKSFARWTEITSGRCREISYDNLRVARNLKDAAGEFSSRRNMRLAAMARDLELANRHLQAVLDNMLEGVLVLDDELIIIQANKSISTILEFDPKDIVGKPFHDLCKDADAESLAEKLRTCQEVSNDAQNLATVSLIQHSGNYINTDISIGRLVTNDQTMLVLVVRDRTNLDIIDELSLRKTKMEALGQFSSSVTHDFNNFLSVISGNIELAELSTADEKVVRYLQAAKHATTHCSELTDRLLTFARDRAGSRIWVDAHHTLNENQALFQSILGDQIEFHVDIDNDPVFIHVEPSRLENAVLNILKNSNEAISGKGDGKGEIHLTSKITERAGECRVEVSVTDDGEGMTDEVREKLLEPFFSTKPPGKGNGLGMMSVNRLVAQLQGNLTIESTPGRGTCITLILPATKQAPQPDLTNAEKSERQILPNILVVDDEQQVRSIICELLRQHGFVVNEASSAESALHKLEQENDVSVVLSDINLGQGYNGLELARIIKERFPGIAVTLITGNKAPDLVEEDIAKQVPILNKPFSVKNFLAVIKKS